MNMHVRAVEHRVTLANDRNHVSGIELLRNICCRALKEGLDGFPILLGILGNFRCYRIEQWQFPDARLQMRRNNVARVALIAGFGEIGNGVGDLQHTHGLERDKLGVAGSDADANECPRHTHSPGLASALTAAAVIALPPMRPRTIKYGKP